VNFKSRLGSRLLFCIPKKPDFQNHIKKYTFFVVFIYFHLNIKKFINK
jgi:hypothetical protein